MAYKHKSISDLLAIIGVLVAVATANPVFAQQSDRLYLYDDFSKGLNTKYSEFSLPKSQGDIVENVRFDTEYKSLSKRDRTVVACDTGEDDAILGLHRLYKKDGTKVTIINYGSSIVTCDDATGTTTKILDVSSGDRRWQWQTWHDLAIGSDGFNAPVKFNGGTSSATYLGTALAVDNGAGAGPNGTYTYKVACYTTSYEISLDTASNPVTVSDNDIDLSLIPICPDTYLGESVIGRNIYRIENGGSTYKLLSNGVIANNTASTLTDSDADGALGATLSPDFTEAPPKAKYPVIHKNRIWFANDPNYPSRIYYSEDASHDFFLSDSYFDVRPNDGDEITFAKNWLGLLTISKTNTIQKINTRGDDPDADWLITDPFSFIGCQAPHSAVNTDVGIMYLGNNGIYAFNGQYSKLISDLITPEIRDISLSNFMNVWGAYYNNKYFITYTSIATGESTNNRVLVADLINEAFSIDLLNINVFHVFNAGSDVEALYSGASDDGLVYAHTDTIKEIIHNKHSDFTGTFDDIRYIPERWGGDPDDPVFELAWTTTVDGTLDADWTGTVDSVTTAIVDRPDTDGIYTSPVLLVESDSFDKLYWHEVMPSAGGDVTFDLRVGGTLGEIAAASWTTGFTDQSGSDISSVAGDTYVQYRFNMDTNDITQTPNLFRDQLYVVRLTYNKDGVTNETTIPLDYRSGWDDFGLPGMVKELRKIYVYYDWPDNTAGTLTLTFTGMNTTGTETDVFNIDLEEHPDYYIDYFPDGNMIGELIRLQIQESSLNPIKIQKIIVIYDVQAPIT